MNGFLAATAITALTAQNTEGVHGVVPIDPAFIAQQIEVVLTEHRRRCAQDRHAAQRRGDRRGGPVPEEACAGRAVGGRPSDGGKGGHRLLLSEAETALRDTLLPMAALITPNLPEAEVLAGFPVRTEADMRVPPSGWCNLAPGPCC